jgi:hypothetical protein
MPVIITTEANRDNDILPSLSVWLRLGISGSSHVENPNHSAGEVAQLPGISILRTCVYLAIIEEYQDCRAKVLHWLDLVVIFWLIADSASLDSFTPHI